MISYNKDAYAAMFGSINEEALMVADKCVSQCTGCMCNCRCSCSGGIIGELEWEDM